jgi:hypothetical protein
MNSMGDVSKKSDAAEKEFDKRILEQQVHKDKQAEKADKLKKDRLRQQNLKMLEALNLQIDEKSKLRENEINNN